MEGGAGIEVGCILVEGVEDGLSPYEGLHGNSD